MRKKTINFLQSWKDGVLGLQHLVGMFGATTLVPLLTGMDTAVALFAAGLGTLLFHFLTKKKVPIFLGSSFAFIPGIIAVGAASDLAYARGAIVIAGLLYLPFALAVYLIGLERVKKIFPSYITGTMIGMIGLTLIPTAVDMASGNFTVAFITLITAVLISYFSKGFLSQLSILIAIGVGYLTSASLGLIDYSSIQNAEWLLIPAFELPKFSIESILMVTPIVLATFMEHIGDIAANQSIVGKDFFSDPGLHKTLIGDGLATSLSGMIGGPANTTYSENTALLKITKNYNPKIIRIAAWFAIGLAFFGKVSGGLQSIPVFVLGGISIMLFWMISKTGLDTIVNAAPSMNWFNWVVVGIMLILGLGNEPVQKLFNINLALQIGDFQLQGIALAALVGIVLNILWNLKGTKEIGEV